MKVKTCRFEGALYRAEARPASPGPYVVFLGRSNVGKSSLINRLLGVKGLARTSSTPGRTRAIHVYRVNEAFSFIDLPGYGYARVSKQERKSWGVLVEGFLERRLEEIASAVLIVDARHGPTDLDAMMRDWLVDRGVRHIVAATKGDKLSALHRAKASRDLPRSLDGADAVVVSAVTGMGIADVWKRLDDALVDSRGRAWISGN